METQPLMLDEEVKRVLSTSYPLEQVGIVYEELKEFYPHHTHWRSLGKNGQVECGTLSDLLHWLAKPPMFTTLRVNTVNTTIQATKELVEEEIQQQCAVIGRPNLLVHAHICLPDCLIVHNTGPHLPQQQAEMEVIVDSFCGMAVLRGADVFKQGILGAPPAMVAGSRVRVMTDLDGKCLRGFTQVYQGRKLYVGTGVACVGRKELFCTESSETRGIGIQMTEPLYHAPSLSGILPSVVFVQNLPSILCGHVLNPLPGQTVIDMCAAPGGKTSHLAVLMENKGRVVALDKTTDKVSRIVSSVKKLGIKCVEAYAFDARNAVSESADGEGGPPYPPNMFDAVLLDGPCSALGQRPSARNKITANSLASFPVLQRKLLSTAVALLRPGGTLVYSTCTVTLEENEEQVAWALRTFPEIALDHQIPHLGGCGVAQSSLTEDDRQLVQRFDPSRLTDSCENSYDLDTIGFFIAKFKKKR